MVNTKNSPLGDYTEWLVSKRMGLVLEKNSQAGFDGVDEAGIRYQIKGRRIEKPSNSIRLSVIRNLHEKLFDYLIAVVFDAEYAVSRAVKIPHAIVSKNVYVQNHVNGSIFYLRPKIYAETDVVDLTATLSGAGT